MFARQSSLYIETMISEKSCTSGNVLGHTTFDAEGEQFCLSAAVCVSRDEYMFILCHILVKEDMQNAFEIATSIPLIGCSAIRLAARGIVQGGPKRFAILKAAAIPAWVIPGAVATSRPVLDVETYLLPIGVSMHKRSACSPFD
jgi:hypothetical protein